MNSDWARWLAGMLLVASMPTSTLAFQAIIGRVDAASPAPDGRHVLVRLELKWMETEPLVLWSEVFLADPARRTLRPLTHARHATWRSPDGTNLVFATPFGLFAAPSGRPSVGRPLMPLPWSNLDLRDGRVTALRFVGDDVVRVLLTAAAGGRTDAWEVVLDGSTAPRLLAEHVVHAALGGPPDPEWPADASLQLLPNALLLGWGIDGRAILRARSGGPYWLVDPNAVDDVELVDEHPGAVREPAIRLVRRSTSCGGHDVMEHWLDDTRVALPPVLAIPFVSNWAFMTFERAGDGTLGCRTFHH